LSLDITTTSAYYHSIPHHLLHQSSRLIVAVTVIQLLYAASAL
jgi:hypothetical protein